MGKTATNVQHRFKGPTHDEQEVWGLKKTITAALRGKNSLKLRQMLSHFSPLFSFHDFPYLINIIKNTFKLNLDFQLFCLNAA
jgi:hypothetical protein